jgi:hypothetical protein
MMPEVGKLYKHRVTGAAVVVLSVKPTVIFSGGEIDDMTLLSISIVYNDSYIELHHSSSGWAHYYQEAQ